MFFFKILLMSYKYFLTSFLLVGICLAYLFLFLYFQCARWIWLSFILRVFLRIALRPTLLYEAQAKGARLSVCSSRWLNPSGWERHSWAGAPSPNCSLFFPPEKVLIRGLITDSLRLNRWQEICCLRTWSNSLFFVKTSMSKESISHILC